MIYTYLINLS